MASLTQEALAEETTHNPGVIINNHNNKNKHWGWKGRTAAIGAAAGALIAGVLIFMPKSSKEDATIEHAKVVRIVPATIDVRAAVYADIGDRVNVNATNLAARAIRDIPFFGNAIMNSEQMSAYFTGPNGNGGGQIETLVGAKTEGVTVSSNESTGKQVINIPARDIVLITRPTENESEVIEKNGTLYDIGAAEWNALPFSEKNTLEQNQAHIDTVARETAINDMQQSCDSIAWPEEVRAITAAYREIAASDYNVQKAAGVTLHAFNPLNVTVNVTGGSPSFPEAYQIPSGDHYTLHETVAGKCTVAPNALQLNPSASL